MMNPLWSAAINPTIDNPIDNIVPNFTAFGVEFTNAWQKIAGGLWALGLLIAIFYLGQGLAAMARHRGSHHPNAMADARSQAVSAGIAVGALASLAVVVGAIFTITG